MLQENNKVGPTVRSAVSQHWLPLVWGVRWWAFHTKGSVLWHSAARFERFIPKHQCCDTVLRDLSVSYQSISAVTLCCAIVSVSYQRLSAVTQCCAIWAFHTKGSVLWHCAARLWASEVYEGMNAEWADDDIPAVQNQVRYIDMPHRPEKSLATVWWEGDEG